MSTAQDQSGNLVRRFHQLQEERVQTYQLYDEGFTEYLAAAPNYNFPLFRQLVHEITLTFKNISQEIVGIQNNLKTKSGNADQVAALICKIQEEEEKKLESTVKLHLAMKNQIDHPANSDYKEEVSTLQQRLKEIKGTITELLEELKYEAEDILLES